MDVIEAIGKRKSVRAFTPDPVSLDMLKEIVEQALRAPSWANTQPWEFAVVTGPMGRGYGNIAQGSHAEAPSSIGDRSMIMIDEKTGSLAHTLFIQGCPGSFSCPSIVHWIQPTSI